MHQCFQTAPMLHISAHSAKCPCFQTAPSAIAAQKVCQCCTNLMLQRHQCCKLHCAIVAQKVQIIEPTAPKLHKTVNAAKNVASTANYISATKKVQECHFFIKIGPESWCQMHATIL